MSSEQQGGAPPRSVLVAAAIAGLLHGAACLRQEPAPQRPPEIVIAPTPASTTRSVATSPGRTADRPDPDGCAGKNPCRGLGGCSSSADGCRGKNDCKGRGGCRARPRSMDPPGLEHACKGQNDCKGQGGCKTDQNECKGMNDCKGKGGCKA